MSKSFLNTLLTCYQAYYLICYLFQMQGEWFLYGHVNYTDTDLVMGSIVNISGGPVQSFMVKQAPFVKDSYV